MARQSIPDRERIVAFAEATVLGAGALVARARESGTVSMRYKRDIELVTSADDASDQFIRHEIQSHFPSDAILSEESGTTGKDSLTEGGLWIVDPIDGTVNFAHGQSQVAVSVAYAHDGEVLAGAVAAPFQEEVFTAAKGRGARRNGSRIVVSWGCGTSCQEADSRKVRGWRMADGPAIMEADALRDRWRNLTDRDDRGRETHPGPPEAAQAVWHGSMAETQGGGLGPTAKRNGTPRGGALV